MLSHATMLPASCFSFRPAEPCSFRPQPRIMGHMLDLDCHLECLGRPPNEGQDTVQTTDAAVQAPDTPECSTGDDTPPPHSCAATKGSSSLEIEALPPEPKLSPIGFPGVPPPPEGMPPFRMTPGAKSSSEQAPPPAPKAKVNFHPMLPFGVAKAVQPPPPPPTPAPPLAWPHTVDL